MTDGRSEWSLPYLRPGCAQTWTDDYLSSVAFGFLFATTTVCFLLASKFLTECCLYFLLHYVPNLYVSDLVTKTETSHNEGIATQGTTARLLFVRVTRALILQASSLRGSEPRETVFAVCNLRPSKRIHFRPFLAVVTAPIQKDLLRQKGTTANREAVNRKTSSVWPGKCFMSRK